MILDFTPTNWYWKASDGRIYSSARNALVYSYDSAYLAFVAKMGDRDQDRRRRRHPAAFGAITAPAGIASVPAGAGFLELNGFRK